MYFYIFYLITASLILSNAILKKYELRKYFSVLIWIINLSSSFFIALALFTILSFILQVIILFFYMDTFSVYPMPILVTKIII